MNPEHWLTDVLRGIARESSGRFGGIGIVLYDAPLALPVTSLVPPDRIPALPQGGPAAIAETARFLHRLGRLANPLHDGFHLIDGGSLTVTHICQFFAPPIPVPPPLHPDHPLGARFMAAFLGSLLPSVLATAVVSRRDGATLIRRGVVHTVALSGGA